jgi:hypothetical protein
MSLKSALRIVDAIITDHNTRNLRATESALCALDIDPDTIDALLQEQRETAAAIKRQVLEELRDAWQRDESTASPACGACD